MKSIINPTSVLADIFRHVTLFVAWQLQNNGNQS
jgi:hypothetical protein